MLRPPHILLRNRRKMYGANYFIRLSNTFLWKRYWKQKQGIVDVVVELNNNSKVNIELQIEVLAYLVSIWTNGPNTTRYID